MVDPQDIKLLVKRNPYTGSPLVDVEGVYLLLARVWSEGYSAGVADGCDDVYIDDQQQNPYRRT